MMGKRAKFNLSDDLETLLTRASLLRLAGDRSFHRGEHYFQIGSVKDFEIDSNRLSARVTGREDYYVDLWAEGAQLQASCTCPLGVDRIFCKHCVAVGLTWLKRSQGTDAQTSDRNSPQKPVTMKDVKSFLEQQEKVVLIAWMLDRAHQDPDWQQQLLLKVAAQRSEGLDITTFRQALENAIEVDEFISWREVYDYAAQINSVLDAIRDLVQASPDAVMELCEEAMPMLEGALETIDDSGGSMSLIFDDVQALHLQACELASPDPIALAQRLF